MVIQTALPAEEVYNNNSYSTPTRPIGPNRVNRAHWPTKENRQNFSIFFAFFRPTQKIGPDGPKWGQEDFFLLIQTLPTFWAERILILRIFIFWIFWIPNFQISRFPDFQKSGLGRAWALGRAGPLGWAAGGALGWAPRVGPRVCPRGGPRAAVAPG